MNAFEKLKLPALVIVLCMTGTAAVAQLPALTNENEPWTADQLLDPAKLAAILKNEKVTPPTILSVSPGPVIPGSLDIGPASEKANMEKLKAQLRSIPKDADIVVYCGCCPFAKCPNIRPAFSLLNDMGYKNHKLLDLPNNIKIDWINKGYPVARLK